MKKNISRIMKYNFAFWIFFMFPYDFVYINILFKMYV